ncbi:MAG: outer membrane protein assembly factor BamE [Hyphomicrobiaceae bacterium]|nr:outer membrane protein assembly factor BamE [Hyphomicrobiaceae bacterium]MCC0024488.1 outer membrane protein assembly factor BamE [Hyphomicrobiaceae bacterium]
MPRFQEALPKPLSRALKVAGLTAFALTLAGCSSGLTGFTGLGGFSTTRVQGTEMSDSQLEQIRPGQSADLVTTVLGSPFTQNTFGTETAYYYVETKVEVTTFGMRMVKERTVLAVYFDDSMRVKDKAVYGLDQGRVITIESRRTPSFGEDRTFVQSLLSSLTG